MKQQVVEKLAALTTAAFGLVAALAWNDSIKAIFRQVFGTQDNLWAQLSYAVLVTIIAVVISIQIGKAAEKVK